MMTLKSISFHLSMFAVTAVSLFAVSCQPDEAEPTDNRDKFVDVWHCVEQSSQVGATNYDVHINLSTTNTSQVLMENFYNVGFSFKAVANVSGTSLTLNQQTYNASQLQGSGSMSGNNTINMSYTVNDGSSIDTCTAVLTRQ
jgi:hypothetical protein